MKKILLPLFVSLFAFQATSTAQYLNTSAPSSVCIGTSFSVSVSSNIQSNGQPGMLYSAVAQLSDASGSFASPVNIGSSYTQSGIQGSFNCTFPATAQVGTTYKLRSVCTGSTYFVGDTISVTASGVGTSITASSGTACAGAQIIFTATVTGAGTAPTYQWKRNGTAIAGATSSTYTTDTLAGSNVLTYTVIGNGTCTSPVTAANDTVNVTAVPATSVTIATSADTICAGTQITLTATRIDTGSTPAYQWMKNGVNITSATSSTYTTSSLANNDTIVCTFLSSLTCAQTVNSNKEVITVNPLVTPTLTFSANPGTSITKGTSVIFTANVTNGGTSPLYQWFLNSAPVTGANAATYTNSTLANNDQVAVAMVSSMACAAPDTVLATAQTISVSSGVANLNGTNVTHIFPNPNTGSFVISGSVSGQNNVNNIKLALIDVTGKTVFTDAILLTGKTYNKAEALPASIANGIYILKITADNEEQIEKVIVNR